MTVRVFGSVTLVKLEQLEKTELPIEIRLLGSVTLVKLEQL